MMRILLAALFTAGAALCQPAGPTAFDVASIKVSTGRGEGNGLPGANIHVTPESLSMRHVTLKACIQWAYHVFEYLVTGSGPLDGTSYDIDAKAASPVPESELRVMLQTLLADRFELKLHRQNKDMQAYVLSVGKNGPKFHESTTEGEADVQPDQKTFSVSVKRMTVAQIIDPLSRLFQMPVVDMTGLTGHYDVALDLAKFIPQTGEKGDPISMIQTGLQEGLGLKLEPKKLSLDLLIIDHAAKSPTGN
jgi:uncharacterized protein (TIGR03435 family)